MMCAKIARAGPLRDLEARAFRKKFLLPKREGEAYEEFLLRAAANPIGRRVKLADLRDNSDLSRITNPSVKDHRRIAKYARAIELIRNSPK